MQHLVNGVISWEPLRRCEKQGKMILSADHSALFIQKTYFSMARIKDGLVFANMVDTHHVSRSDEMKLEGS